MSMLSRICPVLSRPWSQLIPLGLSLLLLGGCSWFSGDEDRVAAKTLPPLEVPPDLLSPKGDPSLARPVLAPVDTNLSKASRQSSEPPRIGERVLPPGKGVQRMREGQRRWLLVAAEPEQVWPLAQKFLAMRGYRVSHDEPAIGLLETDWKERYVEGDAGGDQGMPATERESLRLRIEPAEKPGSTEIFLSQRSSRRVPAQGDAEPSWQLQPPDQGRAVEMLNRLARYLAAEDVEEAVPLKPLSAEIVVDEDGHSALVVAAGFDQAWRRTGLALQALGFVVEDSDQASGIYHVYNDLPSGKTEEELKYGKPESATVREEYWLHVTGRGDKTAVSVHRKSGQADDSQIAGHLLTLLYSQLQ
jgi:outer membrane protein assembly factor BamC